MRPAGFAAANVSALMQMQVHGVLTRKVAKVTEALCDHGFSASTVNRINAKLDADLKQFAERPLEGPFPYLILDARYEKVREDGVVRDRAVLIAVGVDAAGRRQVLGVDLAEGESHASWRRFLESLRDRGLCGVVQVASDNDSGLTKAIREVVPEAVLRGCISRFLVKSVFCICASSDFGVSESCNRGRQSSAWSGSGPAVEDPRVAGTAIQARADEGIMAAKRQDEEFCHPDTVAYLQGLTDEEAAKHSPIVRERDGVLTQYWRVGRRVRCRAVEASGDPASGTRALDVLMRSAASEFDRSLPLLATERQGGGGSVSGRRVVYR